MSLNTLTDFIINKLDALKAIDILHLDVRGKSPITDDMVICTGSSSRHVSSLAQNLITECKRAGFETFADEGLDTADWIVVDLGQTIVHIMQSDSREIYQLEKLWG
ncbi:ribosome-associated, Iojap-like family protein [Pasteurella canis]|uniref:Ribosomal silencing factor RsfS n=1 Tax=Pasteurella canis TaxID=753 RepID=A0A379EVN8_9PAST|nr:ribosome silencing factor [Pasteurella canis]SPY32691.1 ribosome-associated, Iojap-like family protein [Pasteurella canis]SUC10436.1 ribosome-associated, Iojap-like family protein [Pasteurella canis]